ncbi:thiolase family protein [Marinobacter sp. F3R11]|uniref:thiolase family protein n=1 Tax=Marinobacter sp. F3R11 TaxID=2267231 RepID=UPI000DEA0004|nr:thiolase family protein [Marinobacter sp. F3R11]RBW51209.1 steroid 3-ketoacyl-CoA thiolase [Marinobacter sp. F3R11]
MQTPVIIDALRSPMGRGKAGGSLSSIHPVDLLAQLLKTLVERNDIDPGTVDDVLIGCVSQVSEQSATPGRMAWLAAGFPASVPAMTIDRKCGSGQQAIHFAAQGIMAGAYDIAIAGGVESMSRVPMGSARGTADTCGEGVNKRYAPGLVGQGVSAELVSAKWGLGREELDAFAVRSHQAAAKTRAAGGFSREIVPIITPEGVVAEDETIREGSSVQKLGELACSFEDPAFSARFPQIEWKMTAGNSSQIADGASVLLMMSETMAERLGLKPRARFAGFDVCGDDPLMMLTAPIPSTRRALKRSGMRLDQIDHYEVNEAFAPVPLAWQRELGADPERLNPRGGAIALGHPLGASGARLMTTMLHALEQTGGRYGLQTMCEAGGMANTTIIECLK